MVLTPFALGMVRLASTMRFATDSTACDSSVMGEYEHFLKGKGVEFAVPNDGRSGGPYNRFPSA
jgi:hypothetical protein